MAPVNAHHQKMRMAQLCYPALTCLLALVEAPAPASQGTCITTSRMSRTLPASKLANKKKIERLISPQ